MDSRQPSRLRSTAAIDGHPLHPLLVAFPIAFLIGALLTDLAFQGTGDAFWARASTWLIGAGLVSGALAAVAGFVDFIANEHIRSLSLVWYHFIGNAIALALSAVSLYLRLSSDALSVTGTELLLSILVVVIFAVTGWLGGEMVFRHGVGMAGERSSVEGRLQPKGSNPNEGRS
jgi:uncharacterized membrane protein